MESKLKEYLKKHNIQYKTHKHPAVFTVEESKKIKEAMPDVFPTKNLFLKDESKKFFLVCMHAHTRLDLKSLRDKLGAKKKLSFASPEKLKELLDLTPGSVSIFGMINASPDSVELIIDKEVWGAQITGFHPNRNTATLEITHENLERFYNSLQCEKHILEL